MARSQKNQTFVLKINTGYLSKNNWHLTLKLNEIRRRPQLVVSLGSSQVLRWMPELTGKHDADIEASKIKQEIKYLKKQGNSLENKKKISQKYDKLYELQFQPHYMMLVMDSPKDYQYAYKHGFSITIDYGYKTETSYDEYTCPIFVTYKKDENISETTKYEDVFIDNSLFSWMSRSRRTSESTEVATIIDQPQNNIKVMLFIKKDDAEGSDFYYLGKMNYNSHEDTKMKSGESVVNIRFNMESPVPQNLYNYLEGA